jgi:hypothetical protein
MIHLRVDGTECRSDYHASMNILRKITIAFGTILLTILLGVPVILLP